MTNPINDRLGKREPAKGPVTVEQLHEMAERSNRMAWVVASGLPYFVNRRWEDGVGGKPGKHVHFLDRRSAALDTESAPQTTPTYG
jgi:hypothetical protein